MLHPYAHEAVVELEEPGDPAALGAAITIDLCGSLDHEPPCPVAPHHTRATVTDDHVRVRVLFVAEPAQEIAVRAIIHGALARGTVHTAHGSADWVLITSGPSTVHTDVRDHARRLLSGA